MARLEVVLRQNGGAASHEDSPVSDEVEDFAALFVASVTAKQFERGQTIEGTIVAIGPKVAFVSVGGKTIGNISGFWG